VLILNTKVKEKFRAQEEGSSKTASFGRKEVRGSVSRSSF
jgi:cytoplasmic iron level regulating protein YaaA (DUF328/UPF0246 family)